MTLLTDHMHFYDPSLALTHVFALPDGTFRIQLNPENDVPSIVNVDLRSGAFAAPVLLTLLKHYFATEDPEVSTALETVIAKLRADIDKRFHAEFSTPPLVPDNQVPSDEVTV